MAGASERRIVRMKDEPPPPPPPTWVLFSWVGVEVVVVGPPKGGDKERSGGSVIVIWYEAKGHVPYMIKDAVSCVVMICNFFLVLLYVIST